MNVALTIFWISAAAIVYGYVGYPLLAIIYARLAPRPVVKGFCEPVVSLLIPAFNEANVIGEKITNSLALDYPAGKIEILIGSDGSTDGTDRIASSVKDPRLSVHAFQVNRGKTALLNDLVDRSRGEILVFSDASGMLDVSALKELMANFFDKRVGCVSGTYRAIPIDVDERSKAYFSYLDYDIVLKQAEGAFGSIVGAHGALYAIRRSLFRRIPDRFVNDDFYLPMTIVEMGYRAVYEKRAIVTDRVHYTVRDEFRRRVRIGLGNWEQTVAFFGLLTPRKGVFALQFFSHKVLRLLEPFFFIAMAAAAIACQGIFYKVVLLLCVATAFFALAGLVCPKKGALGKIFRLPLLLAMGNAAYFTAFLKYASGRRRVRW